MKVREEYQNKTKYSFGVTLLQTCFTKLRRHVTIAKLESERRLQFLHSRACVHDIYSL